MSAETDHLAADITCIDREQVLATLVATTGAHCEVWRTSGATRSNGPMTRVDLVIKQYREPCSLAEVRVLARQYRELKRALEDMVPEALFVATRINVNPGVVVLAEAVSVWFNIANPRNQDEAIPLLRTLPKARRQLACFIDAARTWQARDRVIDLYGVDNLVLDTGRNVRYVDSFHVFFFSDMLELVERHDDDLRHRVELSLERLSYLEYLLKESGKAANCREID